MKKQYFSFAEIRDTIADMHDINPEKQSAFANRIKNLQRKGFPGGVNTGRGTTANYLWEHLVRLGFVFEILEVGIIPDRAVEFVDNQNAQLFSGLKELVMSDTAERTFFVLSLAGLADLRDDFLRESVSDVKSKQELDEFFASDKDRPVAVIDLHHFVVRLYVALEKVTSLSSDELKVSFKTWVASL